MKLTINTRPLQKVLHLLRTQRVKAAVKKGSRAGCKQLLAAAQPNVPFKSGLARRSLKVRALGRSRKWVGSQVRAQGAPHYPFLELGTKRQRPVAPLKQAAQRVGHSAGQTAVTAIVEELEK